LNEFIAGIVFATIFWQVLFVRCLSLGTAYMIDEWYNKTICIVIATSLYFILYVIIYDILAVNI
jgi:hypothetical protein